MRLSDVETLRDDIAGDPHAPGLINDLRSDLRSSGGPLDDHRVDPIVSNNGNLTETQDAFPHVALGELEECKTMPIL
jgi:hypothetical protein